MNWKFFVGACILVAGLLFKYGAPVFAIALGIGLTALWNWRRHRGTVETTKSKGV
jgi:hypothetical protein